MTQKEYNQMINKLLAGNIGTLELAETIHSAKQQCNSLNHSKQRKARQAYSRKTNNNHWNSEPIPD